MSQSTEVLSARPVTAAQIEAARRADLYAVASPYVSWDKNKSRPALGDWWACCPFHQEKNASFHVLTGKGIFHCFGCGEKGDAIALDMKLSGDDFPVSVERLSAGKVLANDAEARAALTKRKRAARALDRREFSEGCARAVARWEDSFLGRLMRRVLISAHNAAASARPPWRW
jgi:DNA primase